MAILPVIADAPDHMRVSPPTLIPKGYRPQRIGECVGLDAIEHRTGSVRRYILTYIAEVSV